MGANGELPQHIALRVHADQPQVFDIEQNIPVFEQVGAVHVVRGRVLPSCHMIGVGGFRPDRGGVGFPLVQRFAGRVDQADSRLPIQLFPEAGKKGDAGRHGVRAVDPRSRERVAGGTQVMRLPFRIGDAFSHGVKPRIGKQVIFPNRHAIPEYKEAGGIQEKKPGNPIEFALRFRACHGHVPVRLAFVVQSGSYPTAPPVNVNLCSSPCPRIRSRAATNGDTGDTNPNRGSRGGPGTGE